MVIEMTACCEHGHTQTMRVEGMSLEWAKTWAGLMDGSSPFYINSPIGTDSIIGKCATCGAQIKFTVEEKEL